MILWSTEKQLCSQKGKRREMLKCSLKMRNEFEGSFSWLVKCKYVHKPAIS